MRLQVVANGVLIGETWGEGEVVFDDGSTQSFSMPSVAIQMALLQIATYQKSPSSVSFRVKSVTPKVLAEPKPSFTNPFGVVYVADDWLIEVRSSLSIKVNGDVKYEAPESGTKIYYAGKNSWSQLWKSLGLVSIYEPSETVIPLSVENWKVDQYLSSTSDTKIEYVLTQYWAVYGIWFGDNVPLIGKVKYPNQATPLWDYPVEAWKPVWDALINPDPVTLVFQKKQDLPEKGFEFGVTPLSVEMGKSGDASWRTFQLLVQAYGGYTGTVGLATKNLPSGFSTSYVPQSLTFGTQLQGAEMRLSVASTVSEGTYSFSIVASDRSMTKEVTLTAKVSAQITTPDETVGHIATTILLEVSSQKVSPKQLVKVTGKLTDALGKTLSNQIILLSSDFNWTQKVTTDGLGRFSTEFYAPEKTGIYNVNAEFKASGTYAGEKRSLPFEVAASSTNWIDWLINLFKSLLPDAYKQYWWMALAVGVFVAIVMLAVIIKILKWALGGKK